ncbi:4Fe-4S dicluster domain-containing protein [Magnetococcales bacterium HHB-1]
MPTVMIDQQGCRGCAMCVDKCPTNVFEQRHQDGKDMAQVVYNENCIGCLICDVKCPTQCIHVTFAPEEKWKKQRPFFIVPECASIYERLQYPLESSWSHLCNEDWQEAHTDVSQTLIALIETIIDYYGTVQVLSVISGRVSAEHLPEIYESTDLDSLLDRLKERYKRAFNFYYTLQNETIMLHFHRCPLYPIVTSPDVNQEAGTADICQLFHDYLAGLFKAFTDTNYSPKSLNVSAEECKIKMAKRLY